MITSEFWFHLTLTQNQSRAFTLCHFRVDSCESRVEVTTPFWATNSNGKVRAIVNDKQFEQAIHQEICV